MDPGPFGSSFPSQVVTGTPEPDPLALFMVKVAALCWPPLHTAAGLPDRPHWACFSHGLGEEALTQGAPLILYDSS